MIVYELGNGKCVYLTVEQFINLTHSDIQGLIADGAGHSSNNPFRKMKTPKDNEFEEDEDDYENDSPDMLSDGDDDPYYEVDINQIPDD